MKRIGLFYKRPGPGTVKTRLCPPLTHHQAAALYRAFLEDAAGICSRVTGAETVLFRAGDPRVPMRASSFDDPAWMAGLRRIDQEGADLGARMESAFDRLLTGPGDKAILLGSDAPTLPSGYIEAAFRELARNDVVLGPALDGGYYLVGMTRRHPELFREIAWSGPDVLSQTLKAIAGLGLTCFEGGAWHDVDTPADLQHLVRELRGNPELADAAPATRRALSRLGLTAA